jgi:uncharacterized Zn finger protein
MARRRLRPDGTAPAADPIPPLQRQLERLAGARSFLAGLEYYDGGAVRQVQRAGTRVTGTVRGSEPYDVVLTLDAAAAQVVDYDCSCPFHEDQGAFCKHLVALGLALLRDGVEESETAVGRRTKADIPTYLARFSHDALIALVLRLAADYPAVKQSLALQAAAAAPGGPDISVFRQNLSRALHVRGSLQYDDVDDWAQEVETALGQIESLLAAGHGTAVIALAEQALTGVEAAMVRAEDSDGTLGSLLHAAQDLHLRACRVARPDPRALAAQLYNWEQTGDGEVFLDAVQIYADVLGSEGLAEYERLLKNDWDALPALSPGMTNAYDSRRSRITGAMETLARASGDTDRLVAVLAHDLSSPYAFLRIGQVLLEAKRADDALRWAERGQTAYPFLDRRLTEFLIERLRAAKRTEEAEAMAWKHFEESPTEESRYVFLRTFAKKQWAQWRVRALATVRAAVQSGPQNTWARNDGSLVVRLLLNREKDVEAAWAEAQAFDCEEALWLELARRREPTAPQDAIKIYFQRIPTIIEHTGSDYSEPVALLKRLEALLQNTEEAPIFCDFVARLRTDFKRRRNFIRDIDRVFPAVTP